MRYLAIAFALFLLASCGNSKEEQAVLDHVQTLNGIKTDLNAKIKSMEKVKDITGEDSSKMYIASLLKTDTITVEMLQKSADNHYKNYLNDDSTSRANDSILQELNKKKSEDIDHLILLSRHEAAKATYQRFAEEEKKDYELLKLAIDTATAFKAKEGILGSVYKCTYTIKNPLLNATQEITRHFVFSPDGKITGSYN